MDNSTTIGLVAAGFLLVLTFIMNLTYVYVWPGYVAVMYSKGDPTILQPGNWLRWKKEAFHHIFLGSYSMWIPSQEIQTTDKIAARYSVSVEYKISDAVVALSAQSKVSEAGWPANEELQILPLYRFVQAQIRIVIAAKSCEEVREQSEELGKQVLELIQPEFEKWGRTVSSVVLMDIQLPAGIKNAQHQAETERILAAASLEKARSEVASLRALANAAKMIDDNPNLAVLRKIQAIESLKSGSVRLDLD